MAHFLSEVTHERFSHRAVEHENGGRPHTYIPGLTHTHDFYSTMRCISVLERTAEDERKGSAAKVRCWTGDLDGTISIRHGIDGKPIKSIAQEYDNVFVYALQQFGDSMWAGLSNGFLIIYDIPSQKKIFETKGHTGAINRFLLAGDIIFSAGSDWQIVQWNALKAERITGGQFSGHTNAVRCMALDGELLYTGGDDCVIRCWDITANAERTGTWPIIAHHDSVREIVVHDAYLFSTSTDGTINVWNTHTAQLVKQLFTADTSITTLCLDTASTNLWAGSSDGMIHIWDTQDLTLVGVVDDHENTNVAAVRQMARSNAVKAWTVCADGQIRVLYADADPIGGEFEALTQMEAQLQQHVEEHRNKIIANYEELERCKAELVLLEERDKRKKENLAQVLGRRRDIALLQKYSSQALTHLDKERGRQWNEEHLAPLAEKKAALKLLRRYYANWVLVAHDRHQLKHKQQVADYVAQYNRQCLVRTYLGKIAVLNRNKVQAAQKVKLATTLAASNDSSVLKRFYEMWRAFRDRRGMARKAKQLGVVVAKAEQDRLISVYWAKLVRYNRRVQASNAVAAFMGQSCLNASRRLLAAYYRKWLAYKRMRDIQRRQLAGVVALASGNEKMMLRLFYQRWVALRTDRLAREAAARRAAEEEEITILQQFIDENSGYTEDALDRELQQVQLELAKIACSGNDLEAEIRATEKRNMQLKREYLKDVQIDIDKPAIEQVEQAFYFLKARAVSCFHHQKDIEERRNDIKKRGAEAIYAEGLAKVRRVCAKMVKPVPLMDTDGSPDWFTADMFTKMKRKYVDIANLGIVDMCVAFDTLNKGQLKAWITTNSDGVEQWGPKHQHNAEFIANFSTLLEIAVRAFRYRRKEDPVTGEPLVTLKKKSASRARSKSKSKSTKPKRALSAPTGGKKVGAKKKKAASPGGKGKKGNKKSKVAANKKKAAGTAVDGDKKSAVPKKRRAKKTDDGKPPVGGKKTLKKKKTNKKKPVHAVSEEMTSAEATPQTSAAPSPDPVFDAQAPPSTEATRDPSPEVVAQEPAVVTSSTIEPEPEAAEAPAPRLDSTGVPDAAEMTEAAAVVVDTPPVADAPVEEAPSEPVKDAAPTEETIPAVVDADAGAPSLEPAVDESASAAAQALGTEF